MVKLELQGLDVLISALRQLPEDLRDDGMTIVREETEGAAIDIVQAYPSKTGKLRDGVKTFYPEGSLMLGVVRSTSPHSHIYEFGTKDRWTGTRRVRAKGKEIGRRDTGGTKAFRGKMPPHKTTPAIAQRRRLRMYRRLLEMLQRHGFLVEE